jgi:hypothetical protein
MLIYLLYPMARKKEPPSVMLINLVDLQPAPGN